MPRDLTHACLFWSPVHARLGTFRRIFATHVASLRLSRRLTTMWKTLHVIAEVQSIQNLRTQDERTRELYIELFTKTPTRGKAVQMMKKELLELADTYMANLVEAGAFNTFVESSRCLQVMEELFLKGSNAGDEVITASNDTWLNMLSSATAKLPFAVIAVGMSRPGAEIVSVNPAFEALTGYSSNEVLGRNCRFLQGEGTEMNLVQDLSEALRIGQPFQVELTNYRKDGSSFKNLLAIQPVHDSHARYLYCLGVLADAAQLKPGTLSNLNGLSGLLPTHYEDLAQESECSESDSFSHKSTKIVSNLDKNNFSSATRIVLSAEARRSVARCRFLFECSDSLSVLSRDDDAIQLFAQFLGDRRVLLDFWTAATEIELEVDDERKNQLAMELISEYLDPSSAALAMADDAASHVTDEASIAFKLLVDLMPSFLVSPHAATALDALLSLDERASHCINEMNVARPLIWNHFHISPDVGWLLAFVAVADDLPISISVSDMSRPGNPLIYINKHFTVTTGYGPSDALGRNCRFLQGPATTMESLTSLKKQLRYLGDTFIKLNNYRKTGELFQNLLAMRCVRDERSTIRFCIGLALRVDARIQLSEELLQMKNLFGSLPQTLGQDLNSSIDVDTLPAIHRALTRAMAHEDEPVTQIITKPLVLNDRKVGILRCITKLCRLFWSSFDVKLVLAMLAAAPTRNRVLWHLNAHKPEVEVQLQTFMTKHNLLAAQSATALSKVVDALSAEEAAFLSDLHASSILPFVREDATLGEVVAQTQSIQTLQLPEAHGWLDMFRRAVEMQEHAIIACDMNEPGARIVTLNTAFTELTGYSQVDAVGCNCRFLQGEQTESLAVLEIIEALRTAQQAHVELTNYRKDGSSFRNLLSLRPVHDTNGRYRYCIGVLAMADALDQSGRDGLQRLYEMLPDCMEQSLQPLVKRAHDVNERQLGSSATANASPSAQLFSAKLRMLEQVEESFRSIVATPEPLSKFREYLLMAVSEANRAEADAPESTNRGGISDDPIMALTFYLEALSFHARPVEEQRERVHQEFGKYGPEFLSEGKPAFMAARDALSALISYKEHCIVTLSEYVPGFAVSSSSNDFAAESDAGLDSASASSSSLLWPAYRRPADVAEWLLTLARDVEKMPVSVCVSDMRTAGNPLIFVNQAFCQMTGYKRTGVLGRNCRFLQGPDTEVESVSIMMESLRRGIGCTVRITNYRRAGASFQSLLVLRPVHDSNGVYRFVMAIQVELNSSMAVSATRDVELEIASALYRMLPAKVEVGDLPPCAPVHNAHFSGRPQPPEDAVVKSTEALPAIREYLKQIASGAIMTNLRAPDLHDSKRFEQNHQLLWTEIDDAREDSDAEDEDFDDLKSDDGESVHSQATQLTGFTGFSGYPKSAARSVTVSSQGHRTSSEYGGATRTRRISMPEPISEPHGQASIPETISESHPASVAGSISGSQPPASVHGSVIEPHHPASVAGSVSEYRRSTSVSGSVSGPRRPTSVSGSIAGSHAHTEHSLLSGEQIPNGSTAAAAVTAAFKADPGVVYTKLMWLHLRSPEFIHKVLAYSQAEDAWKRSMVERQQPTSKLAFCCASAQLQTLPGEKQRAALFQIAKDYLGVGTQTIAGGVANLVRRKALEVIGELSTVEFGHFLASNQANELIMQLREIDPPADSSLCLDLPPEAADTLSEEINQTPSEALVRAIDLALRHFSVSVLVCDRARAGLPIVSASSGVSHLTHYPPHALVGWNCRILQGRNTDLAAVERLIQTLRVGEPTQVSLTNYTSEGDEFTNLLSIGGTLRIVPGTELVAAVMRLPPAPLQAARSDTEAAMILNLLSSCNLPGAEYMSRQDDTARRAINELLRSEEMNEGRQWMRDAEPALNRLLRMRAIRLHFLNATLQKLPAEGSRVGDNATSVNTGLDQRTLIQEVQLMLHSNNVLCDGHTYLKMACALWTELGNLSTTSGSEHRAVEARLSKKYLIPERGNRRGCELWRCLRAAFYDPLAARELELREGDEEELAIEDLRDVMHRQERHRKPLALGTTELAEDDMGDRLQPGDRRRVPTIGGRSWRADITVGFTLLDDAMNDSSSDSDSDHESDVASDGLSDAASDIASEAVSNATSKGTAKTTAEGATEVASEVAPTTAPEATAQPAEASLHELSDLQNLAPLEEAASKDTAEGTGSQDGMEPSGEAGNLVRQNVTKAQEVTRSKQRSKSASDDTSRDFQMLQHVKLRVLAVQMFPLFLNSDLYAKCLSEIRQDSDSNPLCAILEVELESLKISQPATTEAWAGALAHAVQFLPHAVILSDLSLAGAPIISVNSAFELLTGYDASDVVGGPCRFLQGAESDRTAIASISDAVRTHSACHVTLVNYKKDGTPFLNLLCLKPIFDADGLGRFMLGCLVEVHPRYAKSKLQLRQADRLLKLVDSNLSLPSSPEAKARMVDIKRTVLRPPLKRFRTRSGNDIGSSSADPESHPASAPRLRRTDRVSKDSSTKSTKGPEISSAPARLRRVNYPSNVKDTDSASSSSTYWRPEDRLPASSSSTYWRPEDRLPKRNASKRSSSFKDNSSRTATDLSTTDGDSQPPSAPRLRQGASRDNSFRSSRIASYKDGSFRTVTDLSTTDTESVHLVPRLRPTSDIIRAGPGYEADSNSSTPGQLRSGTKARAASSVLTDAIAEGLTASLLSKSAMPPRPQSARPKSAAAQKKPLSNPFDSARTEHGQSPLTSGGTAPPRLRRFQASSQKRADDEGTSVTPQAIYNWSGINRSQRQSENMGGEGRVPRG
jgi:PAS domain S-box-containing protein